MECQKEIAFKKNQEKVGQIESILVEGFNVQENYLQPPPIHKKQIEISQKAKLNPHPVQPRAQALLIFGVSYPISNHFD